MNKANGDPYVIYGDPAYPVRSHILAPFRNAQLTPAEQNFNEATSAVNQCYTKFATTAEGPKMSQAKQLVEAKFSVRECFTSRL